MMEYEDEKSQNMSTFTSMDAMESILLDSSYGSAMSQSLSASDAHPLESRNEEENMYKMKFSSRITNNNINMEGDPFREPLFPDAESAYEGTRIAYNSGLGDYTASLPLSSSSSSSSFSEYLNITVSQPQKALEGASSSIVPGSNTYVTYLIVTRTNIPHYGQHEFTVRRRFRDVVALADRLAESYRGYFVPFRPDKSIVESQVMQKQEFIEHRRAAIEKYLHRLANHHVIRLSKELKYFLQSNGKLPFIPTTGKAPRMINGETSSIMAPQNVKPGKDGRDIVRIIKELKQSVTNEWSGVKPSVNEEEKEFLEKKEKLEVLEHRLGDASKEAEALIKAYQEVGEIMGELGLAFIKLAKFETEKSVLNAHRTHIADTKWLGTASVKACRLYRDANVQSMKHLDQLHEYLSLMQSIHSAFSDRSAASLTVQTLITEISTLNARIEKLKIASSKVFGGDKTKKTKMEELKEALATIETSRITALSEYERIKEINRSELEHFDSDKQRGFLEMIKGFVHTQVRYAEKSSNVWSMVAEEYSTSGNVPSFPVVTTTRH